jgi:hypothetical protein
LDGRLGGTQSRSGRSGEKKKKKSQLTPGLKPPFIQPVAQLYTTELTRLLRSFLLSRGSGQVSFYYIFEITVDMQIRWGQKLRYKDRQMKVFLN